MSDREWVFVRAKTMLIGVPSRDGGEDRTIPAGSEAYMPLRDAQRHQRKDNVIILSDTEAP